MDSIKVKKVINGLNGVLKIPGDKSISHRAVMFGSIAEGTTLIDGFLEGEDCLSTIDCFKKLGVEINRNGTQIEITGKGLDGLVEPSEVLDVGNSGTTLRLLMGILSGRPFSTTFTGDSSIGKRPMNRVTVPLSSMGARIDGRDNSNLIPIHIRGGDIEGMEYHSPVASAQVKSAILLAGLQGKGRTTVIEPNKSRDHTERMLQAFGVMVEVDNVAVSIEGGQKLIGTSIQVPGDISSAAFWLIAGCVIPNSEIVLKNVGLNPTRAGIMDVLQRMGADITIMNQKDTAEPVGDITIRTSNLKGIEIGGDDIPRLIDEIPIIALAASVASGETIIKDAKELRVKETDRIETVVTELAKLGVTLKGTEDGIIITGGNTLIGANVDSHGDHRIGMMLAIAGCIASGETTIEGASSVAVSYPTFFEELGRLKGELV